MRGALSGIVGVFATVAMVGVTTRAAPPIVYVEAQCSAPSCRLAAPPITAPLTPPQTLAAERNSPTEQTPPKSIAASGSRRAELLTEAFARHLEEVQDCFAEYTPATGSSTSILVQFAVDRRGHVRSASLIPHQLIQTQWGRCVARVASTTRFGRQPHPLAFRIPVVAHAAEKRR